MIEKKWRDSRGNIWYRVASAHCLVPYMDSKATKEYALVEVHSDGKTLEGEWSTVDFPSEFGALKQRTNEAAETVGHGGRDSEEQISLERYEPVAGPIVSQNAHPARDGQMVVTIIGPAGCFAGVQAEVLPREQLGERN